MCKGKFIVFCGINGSGKTTIINKILKKLNNKTNIFIWKSYKCPDRTTPIGKKIDEILKGKINVSKDIELKFFSDNRKEVAIQIEQCINNGINVICDRYLYCNIAYTLTSQTLEIKKFNKIDLYSINTIAKLDKDIIKPDCVFLIVGNYLHLRDDKKEKYHITNDTFNDLIINNYILSFIHTKTPFIVIENVLNNLDNTTNKIINHINSLN